ncbi:alpha/beta-hydrolase [Mycena floridula]|nr:alpha/beta-hydrolase [Mycena floridula]
MSTFAFRSQPLKAVYLLYFILSTLFIRLPFWALVASIPAWRPRRSWSFIRSIQFLGMKTLVKAFFHFGFPLFPGHDPRDVASSPTAVEETGFVWVQPLVAEQIVGELEHMAEINGVIAMPTSGYWFGSVPKLEEITATDKVILHLHSGGHVMGSAHSKSGPAVPVSNGFLQHYPRIKRIFSCSYRLSSSFPYPALNPFPAGLLDALAGYNYLVHTLGYQPKNIIISGDSAGGNLAIGLVLYLSKNTFPETLALPVPGALILLSPSVEWSLTHDGPNSSWRRNQASDYGVPFFALGYSRRSLLGKLPADTAITSPWISPGSRKLKPIENLFAGFPPTYILVGEAEIACDSIRTFRDRLCEDIGKDKVRYNEVMDATHDILAMTWFEPERTHALKDIASWLKTV